MEHTQKLNNISENITIAVDCIATQLQTYGLIIDKTKAEIGLYRAIVTDAQRLKATKH